MRFLLPDGHLAVQLKERHFAPLGHEGGADASPFRIVKPAGSVELIQRGTECVSAAVLGCLQMGEHKCRFRTSVSLTSSLRGMGMARASSEGRSRVQDRS